MRAASSWRWPQRDELFADNPALQAAKTGTRWFNAGAYTVGYTRDLGIFRGVQTGLGANISLYSVPDAIKTYYGDHPLGMNACLRVRLT